VVLTDDQGAAVALWVAHTHAFDAAIATPYLWISSAEMESGKTRLLEVLRLVTARPWFTGRTTSAALVRKIDKATPTLLLDESDAAFNGDREYAETLRGVLNTGYGRGGAVTVCTGQGANIAITDFSSFCPKAIAGLGKLPDTVQSRSIPIRLKKKLPSEPVERFRERKARADGELIADWLEDSAEPIMEALETAEPELPDELSDRAQDVWEPLLAIADAAGGEWPQRARVAAVRLSGPSEPDEATLGVRLLADCREAFADADRLTTQALITYLVEVEEAPWGSWNDGGGIRPRELANKLRPYGIKSQVIRIDAKTPRGYLREQFEDAWNRYLPSKGDSKRNTRNNGRDKPKTAPPQTQHTPPMLRIENPEKPHQHADVADVADRTPEYGLENDSAGRDDSEIERLIADAKEVEREHRQMGLRPDDDGVGL
jgi:hypothetical protein